MTMPIKFETGELSNNRNYIFKSEYPGVYAYLVDTNFYIIYVRNDINRSVKFNRRNRVGKLVDIEKE